MLTLSFNGYRLDLSSGGNYPAEVRRITLLPEGRYEVEISNINKPFTPPLLPQNHLKLRTLFPLAALDTASYIYDHDISGVSGLKVDPSFFFRLRALMPSFVSGKVVLSIKYAAPWMEIAKGELGQSEVAGKKANPKILEYFKSSKFWGKDDSGGKNAWCASFVSWVMEKYGSKPPKSAFRAKSWKSFGKEVKSPIYGAIGIKSRKGGGHVGFGIGKSQDGKHLYILGGNQSDEVNISRYSKDVWEKFVVPTAYDPSKDSLPTYTKKSVESGSEA